MLPARGPGSVRGPGSGKVAPELPKYSYLFLIDLQRVVKFWNPATRVFIARVGRENLPMLEQAICFITSFEGRPCRVRILHISGTLDKVENKYKVISEQWLETTNKKMELKYAS